MSANSEFGCERCARVTGGDGYALPVVRVDSTVHDNKSMALCEQCLMDALASLKTAWARSAVEGVGKAQETENLAGPAQPTKDP